MIKKMGVVLILLAVFTLVPASGWAASPWTQETTYQDKVLGKLVFGLKNTFTGWTALFTEPVNHYKDHKGAGHVFEGVFSGLARTIFYTGGGVVHLVTFPIPVDVPLLDDGVKCPFTGKK